MEDQCLGLNQSNQIAGQPQASNSSFQKLHYQCNFDHEADHTNNGRTAALSIVTFCTDVVDICGFATGVLLCPLSTNEKHVCQSGGQRPTDLRNGAESRCSAPCADVVTAARTKPHKTFKLRCLSHPRRCHLVVSHGWACVAWRSSVHSPFAMKTLWVAPLEGAICEPRTSWKAICEAILSAWPVAG